MSGATPAALGLLADVSEGFEEDRSAIMGLYSVFLGLGQVLGAVLGGIFASWRGIDGLLLATALLLVVGLVALANLRGSDGAGLNDALRNGAAAPSLAASRARLAGVAGTLEPPADGSAEEKR
jgi:MFS family permease